MMAKGQCNCGAVAFEIAAKLTDIYLCHCSICRKSTGGGGIAVVVVHNKDFRWRRGQEQVTTWQKPGHDWQTSFCQGCGSPLPGPNDESRMYVPAGLIDEGGENLRVAHHIWVDSKAHWDNIGDDGQQHTGGFGD
ncbi:MAG: GFA family protein [Xanthomonadales bacterium]|nr:GFA family protein [Xanthomonadales bacterium]